MSKAHTYSNRSDLDVGFPTILTPYIRTPMTDVLGTVYNHQQYGACGKFELKMMECLEAYGADKGRLKCSALIDDFNECRKSTKQWLRTEAMHAERERQYKAGLLKEKYAAPPEAHAF